MINEYGYNKDRFQVEKEINFGREKKRADIVIGNKENKTTAYIILELKKANEKDGKDQLKSYTHATGAPIAIWSNGVQIVSWRRRDPNTFEPLASRIPFAKQSLEDFLNKPYTYFDLILDDEILTQGKTLQKIIKNDMEDEVLANAGVDVFEECLKLIMTKLYDESQSFEDKRRVMDLRKKDEKYLDFINRLKQEKKEKKDSAEIKQERPLQFKGYGDDEALSKKIQELFDNAKDKWKGIFPSDSKIELKPSHLAVCVNSLQSVKLFNSNLDVIDEAFEYLVSKSSKGEKGQYFTRRFVIDMCVKMLNPQKKESMIDPASGSGGFPIHTIFYKTNKLFTGDILSDEDKEAIKNVFCIDFDYKSVRSSRLLNLIAGDGETNVLYLNSLDFTKWDQERNIKDWRKQFEDSLDQLQKLRSEKKSDKNYQFDLLMTNPPFAGDIKQSALLTEYEIAKNAEGKMKPKVGRDILFIERCLNMVKPGGRLCMVLPQGRFNNTSDQLVREFFMERARVLAVVSLGVNTFKPHTGTKTSVLFLQKWNEDDSDPQYFCPKKEDYKIFFAVSEKSGIDNSGDKVFIKDENGRQKIDKTGHAIVDHDLHNHDGEIKDGIAEAFIEFAKKEEEKLSFWRN